MKTFDYPKITIVTPNLNQGAFLEFAICSILSQNYPNLEYIIIDGGSTDNSLDIIKKYEKQISYWISEPDNGMYDAIQKGFEKSSGEIMGWLNSDDMLHQNSLFVLAEVFKLDNVYWVQGIPTVYDEKNRTIQVDALKQWSKYEYWSGNFTWIQQESTFWHRTLWEEAGSYVSRKYKYAGDMELWNRFFFFKELYSLNTLIGGYRARTSNQLSLDHLDQYLDEAKNILKDNLYDREAQAILKKVEKLKQKDRFLKKYRFLKLYRKNRLIKHEIIKLYKYPPVICFDRYVQQFYKKEL